MPLKEIAERQNLLHAKSTPQTILKHVLDDVRMGETALVSSFGAESVVLLHMVAEIGRDTPVIFIETEMLFDETLAYQKEVADLLGLTNVQVVKPSRVALLERDSEGLLHQADVDACCTLRKKEPLERALASYGSWITGRKRYQGGIRAALPVFEKEAGSMRVKVNPLASWGRAEIAEYMDAHDLPRHPLVAKGFPSIGCKPCTHAVGISDDPRAGRWEGSEKTECGIHF
jgi:phosphoadenosine phosphosulfate reductase